MKVKIKQIAQALHAASQGKKPKEIDQLIDNTAKMLTNLHLQQQGKELLVELAEAERQSKGIVLVQVSSKSALSPKDLQLVERWCKARLNAELELMVQIDPTIIGGIKLNYLDREFDATVNRAVSRLHQQLINN